MKTILVTGAAGYIGSHVMLALKQAGHHPIGIDNFSRGNRFVSKALNLPIHDVDIADEGKLTEILKRESENKKIDAVVHLAAFAYVEESVKNPALYLENNVAKSIRFFSILSQFEIQKIVFSSTCAVYGIPDKIPITESQEKKPVNPYGVTKLICEQVLKTWVDSKKTSVVCLRYFNVAGAAVEAGIGEAHQNETHVIPRILESIQKNSLFQVFGTDFPTADGTCVRDYIHVKDIASAHIHSLQYLDQHSGFYAFNLGNNKGFSVKEVLACAEKITQKKAQVQFAGRREGDPAALVGDPTLARKELGWTPNCSTLEQMISDAWKWHLSFTPENGQGTK